MAVKSWDDKWEFSDDASQMNLSRTELEGLSPKKLVDIIMWQRRGMEMLNDRMSLALEERLKLDQMINQLSIDPGTGVLTFGAVKVLTDILVGGQILEVLKDKGFTLKICMLDVDELRKHNALGGHEGGDIALQEIAKRLKILFRRKSDLVAYGLIDALADAHRSVHPEDGSFNAHSRFERGDEMIAWRFAPPPIEDIQRRPQSVSREVTRIKKGFDGAIVSYPVLPELSKDDIKRLDPEGRYKVESGIVTAPATVTFACVYAPMPTNRTELRRILRRADELVMTAKNARQGKAPSSSVGTALKLTEDDLI